MALINLHNHSTFSDGTVAPGALALEAARAGINYFSLTDHDTTDGWAEMAPALKAAGISYCFGVEISTREHGNLHILGYGIDPASPGLTASLGEFRGRRTRRIKNILERLSGLGIEITLEDLAHRGGCSPGRAQVADLMLKRGLVEDISEAFKRYLAPGTAAYVESGGPTVEEAITAIHRAGGKAVLAHPGKGDAFSLMPGLKEAGLDGLEAFYPSHTGPQTRAFLDLAARYDLFATAGYDFHGPPFERREMKGFEYSDEYFSEVIKLFI